MKKFIIDVTLKGWRTYECIAENKNEALDKCKKGDCRTIAQDIEVVSLGEPEMVEEQ